MPFAQSFRRVLIPAGLVMTLATAPAWAQVDEAAKARLQDAAGALKAATALRLKAQVVGTGLVASATPASSGDVIMLREPESGAWIVRATGEGARKPGETKEPFDVVWFVGSTRYVDHAAKKVHEHPGKPRPLASVRAADALRLQELTDAEPLRREIASANIAFGEATEIGGEPVDVVVAGAGRDIKNRVYISKNDNLPRKIERVFEGASISGNWGIELTELSRPTDLTPASFAIPVPEGYTEEKVEGKVATPARPAPDAASAPGATTDPLAVAPSAPGLTATPMTTPAATEPAPAAPAVQKAIGFELEDASGKKVTLADYKGNVVLLDFWGTWCIPCRASHKELQQLAEAWKDKPVKIVSLAVRERTREAPIEYMKKGGYTFDLLLNADKVAADYQVKAYPTFVAIGFDGEILGRADGYVKDTTLAPLRTTIEEYISNRPAKDAPSGN